MVPICALLGTVMQSRTGIAFLTVGLILLAAAGSYYGYTFYAGRDLHRMNVNSTLGTEEVLQLRGDSGRVRGSGLVERHALYPGILMPARQWSDPRGTIDLDQGGVLVGFVPVSHVGRPVLAGDGSRATAMAIPSLGVTATVTELSLIDAGDSISYTTPKMSVGHIPETPNPGSQGNGWFFGHLESPLQREGNVFAALPRVPELLADGEDVLIILATVGREYLYQVSHTELLHEDNLRITTADDARITLVTCYPRLKYDHRLVVTAQLIGFRDSPSVS